MASNFVNLQCAGSVVGYAKFFMGGSASPSTIIHGHSLRSYAREDEDLVAIYHVQIFQEFESLAYPYSYHCFDGIPKVLGDLNCRERNFRSIVAWDKKKTVPGTDGRELGSSPIKVSAVGLSRKRTKGLCTISGENSCRRESFSRFRRNDAAAPSLEEQNMVPLQKRLRFSERVVDSSSDFDDTSNDERESLKDVDVHSTDSSEMELATENAGDHQDNYLSSVAHPCTDLSEDNDNSSGTEWPNGQSFTANRRRYIFRSRTPSGPKRTSTLREHRLKLSRRVDNPFQNESLECCRARCFKVVDRVFAFAEYKRILPMSRKQFSNQLAMMYTRDKEQFQLRETKVCARFLSKGFHFSACLQSAVKAKMSTGLNPNLRLTREHRGDTKSDVIVNYLTKLAEDTGDKMPNKEQTHLPSTTKKQVYQEFTKFFLKTFPANQNVPSMTYFYSVWKAECPKIKTHRSHGFTVCSKCELIRTKMEEAMGDDGVLEVLKSERVAHLKVMREERRQYAKRRDLSISRPSQYYSIILDGADQKGYGLPHFICSTKSDRGHKLKVKCIGVLEHLKRKCLTLFTMTEEFQSGANHVIEATHRVINERKEQLGKLPPVLFVQADNCTRENKNRYFLAYFELLVAKGVFLEVQISCLPVGHTHTDIDQSFSSVATHLRANKAETMGDLLRELKTCYSPGARAFQMTHVANFSGLCEESGCLNNPNPFSHYRYFRITRVNDSFSGTAFKTFCEVNVTHDDEWADLITKELANSFLRRPPDLATTPPTVTRVPDNILEINRHLNSVEERIRDPSKMEELRRLRNRVYTARSDSFHWDLDNSYEENGDYLNIQSHVSSGEELESDAETYFNYDVGFFVVVKTAPQERSKFWIARILEKLGNNTISVRWYIVKGQQDAFTGQYEVARRPIGNPQNRSEFIPYDDVIHSKMVLVYFESLTRDGSLRSQTQSAVRAMLDCN